MPGHTEQAVLADPSAYSSMAPANFKARQAAENKDPNKMPQSGNINEAI